MGVSNPYVIIQNDETQFDRLYRLQGLPAPSHFLKPNCYRVTCRSNAVFCGRLIDYIAALKVANLASRPVVGIQNFGSAFQFRNSTLRTLRGTPMPNSDLITSLHSKHYENQLALEASIMELSNWVEQRGSAEVAENVRGALYTLDHNQKFIKMTLAVLMTPE